MKTTESVPVLLDLRASREVPAGPSGYRSLWALVEPALLLANPREERPLRFDRGDLGHFDVRFVTPPLNPAAFGPDTAFTIVGVVEPSYVRYACATCRTAGQETYGPFLCHVCKEQTQADERLCDTHVRILDGAFRTTCPDHEPCCRHCGRGAVFWCDGPRCERRAAWCEQERHHHPGNPEISYCRECFADRFPRCVHPGCRSTGHLRCEFTPEGEEPRCHHRMCAPHAVRWQIYGPSQRGLSLCPQHHAALPRLSQVQLLRQVVGGTARRAAAARRRKRKGPELPRLRMVRHIFINVRDEVMDVRSLGRLFASVRARLGSSASDAEVARLIDSSEPSRRRELETAETERQVGLGQFARLVELLRAMGRADLAGCLAYSEYGGRTPVLWVRATEGMEREFLGNRPTSLRNLGLRLDLRVQMERR